MLKFNFPRKICKLNIFLWRLIDTHPAQIKPALIRAPTTVLAVDSKNVSQYEAVFLQLADEHRSVNAFELHELLEACLPNGIFFLPVIAHIYIMWIYDNFLYK